MTPVAGGRHCASCNKAVTDFTGMTDRELAAFIKNGGVGCGRFYAGQLGRTIVAPPAPKYSWWLRAAISIGLYFGFSSAAAAQKKAPPRQAAAPVAGTAAGNTASADASAIFRKPDSQEILRKRAEKAMYIMGGTWTTPLYDHTNIQTGAPEEKTSIPSLYRKMFPLKKKPL